MPFIDERPEPRELKFLDPEVSESCLWVHSASLHQNKLTCENLTTELGMDQH